MSEGPLLSESELLAAEHALGVLTARERADAEARMAREPAFAAEVESWRMRFAPMVETVEPVPAPGEAWARIERRLPANDNSNNRVLVKRLRFWRGTTVGSLGLAAASLAAAVMLGNQPPVVIQPPEPEPLLNVSMGPDGAQPLFIASYDPLRKTLIVTSLQPQGSDPLHVYQLWLIPSDGKPRAVGFVDPGKSKSIQMPQEFTPLAGAGAALAVSIEAPGGSTTEKGPQGPIAAAGKLAQI